MRARELFERIRPGAGPVNPQAKSPLGKNPPSGRRIAPPFRRANMGPAPATVPAPTKTPRPTERPAPRPATRPSTPSHPNPFRRRTPDQVPNPDDLPKPKARNESRAEWLVRKMIG